MANNDDDILKRAQKLLDSEQKANEDNAVNSFIAQSKILSGFKHFFNAITLKWNKYFKPIAKIFNPIFRWYWQLTKKIFAKFARNKSGNYPKSRGSIVFLFLCVFNIFFAYQLVVNIIPTSVKLVTDAIFIPLFSKEETLVFSQPSSVEGHPGVFSVYACRRYPCEGQTDSIEFRMRDSLYLDIRRFFTHLEPHDPGELAGAFVSEENLCKVDYYGRRIKYLRIYANIIRAKCYPVNGDNYDEVSKLLEADN